MTPKRQRMWFVVIGVACLCAGTLLAMKAFRENIVFFHTPSELSALTPEAKARTLRIGGLVEQGSIAHENGEAVRFRVTDGNKELVVRYQGILPSLFREGQGVVAEGKLEADGSFAAARVLAKHDENYMPREVAEKLKSQGYWRGGK